MKDNYGVELLPKEFIGTGSRKGFWFKQIKGNQYKYLYAVHGKFDIQYEVIKPQIGINPISKTPFERYPSEKSLDILIWKFDVIEDAINFYKEL